jgi:RNA polymerase sigma-70 factor (ECF subfamily)
MELYNKAVKDLPKEYREAFEMNRFKDMTYNEIASKMGISPKTIAYRISQAIRLIRIQLTDFLPFFF